MKPLSKKKICFTSIKLAIWFVSNYSFKYSKF